MVTPEAMKFEITGVLSPKTPEALPQTPENLDVAWETIYKPQRRVEVINLVRQKLSQAQASFEPVKGYAAAYGAANRFQQDQEVRVMAALRDNKLFAPNNAGLLRWAESYCGDLTQYKPLFV